MNDTTTSQSKSLGLQFVLLGAAVNRWSLAWLLTDDWHIASGKATILIGAFQAVCIGTGLVLLSGSRVLGLGPGLRRLAAFALAPLWLAGLFGSLRVAGVIRSGEERQEQSQIERVAASEVIHLNLNAERLKKLKASLADLNLPGPLSRTVFADEVRVRELAPGGRRELVQQLPSVGTDERLWELEGATRTVARGELDLLRPFLDRIEYLESGKFFFYGGDFEGDDFSVWTVKAGFKAFGRYQDGTAVKAKAHLHIRWELDDELDPAREQDFKSFDRWHIAGFELDDFLTIESPQVLFAEELDRAVPDVLARREARRNRAQELVVEMLRAEAEGQPFEKPHPFFNHAAASENPAVSVVDINRDGFDDVYFMPRYGPNQLFVNTRRGTFDEVASQWGLDVEDHCSVALFADFDNDGDDDLFLGRTLARSLYLENTGDRFVDASDKVEGELPYFAMTASAADLDRDGLLDLYVGTYAATLIVKEIRNKGWANMQGKMFGDYLPDEEAGELFRRYVQLQENRIRDRVGPPNVVLMNAGEGRLAVDRGSPLAVYRNTYQSSFADADNDGDLDVYVANDFAPNDMFLREEGGYRNATDETNAADIGFGMGVSWGDYDRDGDQDAYVSNMYSKAGNRILDMVGSADRRFKRMAGGNSLLEWQDGGFTLASSVDGSGMHVEMGGWSWGSQWVDVDNDAWLDLFALSGYYSAPAEIEAGHDL